MTLAFKINNSFQKVFLKMEHFVIFHEVQPHPPVSAVLVPLAHLMASVIVVAQVLVYTEQSPRKGE